MTVTLFDRGRSAFLEEMTCIQLEKAGRLLDDPLPDGSVWSELSIIHAGHPPFERWLMRNYEQLRFLHEAGVLG